MKDRRPLSIGINAPVDPEVARNFIHADKKPAAVDEIKVTAAPKRSSTPTENMNRVPISTRIRGDFADALKRASLERQLNKVEPNTLTSFFEEALEPWLKTNGYI